MKIGLRTVKTAVASILAMLLANYLQLLYAPAAGVIAILSVGNTKKSSLKVAGARLVSLALAIVISFFCFTFLGFNPGAFGLFLLVFIPLSTKFNLTDGIVVNSVIVTHFMIEQTYAWFMLRNSLLLMGIGAGIALLMNLYMPDIEKDLKMVQNEIEDNFRLILAEMARTLNYQTTEDLKKKCHVLLLFIRNGQQKAQMHQENQWQAADAYYEEYFSMRRTQMRLLTDMADLLKDIQVEETWVEQLRPILLFTAETFHEENDGEEILKRLSEAQRDYRNMPLPETRVEFENRARLFQFIQSFKSFIEIKAEFSKTAMKSNENSKLE